MDRHLRPVPEFLNLASLEHGDRLHLRISGETLIIEKVSTTAFLEAESPKDKMPVPELVAPLITTF